MKIIVLSTLLAAVALGLAIQWRQPIDLFAFDVQADGSLSLRGTVSQDGRPLHRLDLDSREEHPPLRPGDEVVLLRVSHRIFPIGFKTWKIRRNGATEETSVGKARYYCILWSLTLSPLLLGMLGFAGLACVGRRVTP